MKNYDKAANIVLVFIAVLTGALVGLKAAGVIACSWWLVFAPLWVPVAITLALVHFVLACVVFYAIAEGVRKGIEAVKHKC